MTIYIPLWIFYAFIAVLGLIYLTHIITLIPVRSEIVMDGVVTNIVKYPSARDSSGEGLMLMIEDKPRSTHSFCFSGEAKIIVTKNDRCRIWQKVNIFGRAVGSLRCEKVNGS